MGQDSERRSKEPQTKHTQATPLAQLQDWLADWRHQREALRLLTRERAKLDERYSWMAAEREMQLMDGAVMRLNDIVSGLARPANMPED